MSYLFWSRMEYNGVVSYLIQFQVFDIMVSALLLWTVSNVSKRVLKGMKDIMGGQ